MYLRTENGSEHGFCSHVPVAQFSNFRLLVLSLTILERSMGLLLNATGHVDATLSLAILYCTVKKDILSHICTVPASQTLGTQCTFASGWIQSAT